MSNDNCWEYAICFDDGGVMNDNKLRGIHWQKMIGEYFSPKYGGEPHRWAEANFRLTNEFSIEHVGLIDESQGMEFNAYYDNFINRWISEMFDYVGVSAPPKNQYRKIFFVK